MTDRVCCSRFQGSRSRAKPLVELGKWAAPGAALLLIPKCPLCVAVYITAATGIGFSVSAAGSLRYGAIAVCMIALAWLVGKRTHEWINRPS